MTGTSVDEAVKGRPKRQSHTLIEHELHPRHVSWLDLLPEHAGCSTRFVFTCLEYGVLEAWQDSKGAVRLYLPESCGGHLILGAPGDAVEPINLACSDPAHGDPDALVRREGAQWITLLPGIQRARKRPRPSSRRATT